MNQVRPRFSLMNRSRGGVHVSIYIEPHTAIDQRQARFEAAVEFAMGFLRGPSVRGETEEITQILDKWSDSWVQSFPLDKGLAVFVSSSFYRAMALPAETSPFVSVASSFHLKPLIKLFAPQERRFGIERELDRFREAEAQGRVQMNLFQIAKSVSQGRVEKLFVAEDEHLFGQVDLETGGLRLHPMDLDHEDDDVLDDLSQIVLGSGGEVCMLPRDQIPYGRPVVAVLKNRDRISKSRPRRLRAIG